MRKLLLLPLALWACGGAKDQQAETAAMTPAALSAADVTGTWTGATTVPTDSTMNDTWTAWVMANAAGGIEGKIVSSSAPNDTVAFTTTISGDSITSVSAAFTPAGAPAGAPQMTWTSVGRTSGGGAWSGTAVWMNAGSDSVVQAGTWVATRTP